MIYFKGEVQELKNKIISMGSIAPDFSITKSDMQRVKLSDFKNKTVIFNIFPSIDTGVCATSVRRFNQMAAELTDCVVICISNSGETAELKATAMAIKNNGCKIWIVEVKFLKLQKEKTMVGVPFGQANHLFKPNSYT